MKSLGYFLTTAGLALMSNGAFAAGNVNELASNLENQITGIASLALTIARLGGVVIFCAGLFLLYKDSKQPGQDHAKKGIIALLVGSALIMAPALMSVGTQTLANQDSGVSASGTQF